MTFASTLGQRIREGFCAIANTAQDFGVNAEVGVEYRGFGVGVNVIRLMQRLACNREPAAGYDPDFLGGQCPNVQYNVTVFYEVFSNGVLIDSDTRVLQPFGEIYGVAPVLDNTPPGTSYQIQLYVNPLWNSGNTFYNVSAGSGGDNYTAFASILSISRVDGLPDECGNRTPVVPPSQPGSRTTNINFTYTDNSSNDIDVEAEVTFGDIVFGINGDVNIPFQVTYDDILPFTFNGTLNLNTGDVKYSPGNKSYPPSKQPNGDGFNTDENPPTLPDVPEDAIPPSANDPDPEVQRVIRGAFVTTVVDDSRGTVIDQLDTPDIIAPNLGYIQFAIAVSDKVGWTPDIPVKNHRFFSECPWVGGAIEVRGTPRPGVEWIITPVYANEEKTQTFE